MKNPPNKPDNKKRSALALASFLFAIASIFMWLLAAVPAIITGLAALVIIHRSKGKIGGKRLALWGISLSVISTIAIFFLAQFVLKLWLLDAPPIPDDYTTADLRSAPADCTQSYALLLTLAESKLDQQLLSGKGLTNEDITVIGNSYDRIIKPQAFDDLSNVLLPDSNKIELAWQNAQKNRNTISQLLQFSEIADLSQPNLSARPNFTLTLTDTYKLYMVHASLQMQQNNTSRAIEELIEIDSIIRKLAPNVRTLVTKLGLFICLTRGYETAAFFINHPDTSPQMIETLKSHFTPLTDQQLSLRNICIFQYLILKDAVAYSLAETTPRRKALLKPNSTFRVYRNFWDTYINYDRFIDGNYEPYNFSVWPENYPDSMPKISLNRSPKPWDSSLYKIYNLTGQNIMAIRTLKFERFPLIQKNIQTTNELFQILLKTRQGLPSDFKSGLRDETYIVDTEKRIIYSKGPDNKSFTKDDIKLTINPKILIFDKTNK